MRIYVDHPAVEIFTGGGQALATKCARHTLTLTLPHAFMCVWTCGTDAGHYAEQISADMVL